MIQINKGVEPAEWTERKSTPGFTEYEPIDELRDALLREQYYICAYCMRRIPVKDLKIDTTSKIEHIKSRENSPDLQLNYSNMAICCPGNLNNEPHCDNLKGSRSVSFDLYSAHLQETISYSTKDGSIKSSREDWNNEMESVLNLNHSLLKLNRKNKLEGVVLAIKSTGWQPAMVRRKFNQWIAPNAQGKKEEYCGIVIWYLNKKIKQL